VHQQRLARSNPPLPCRRGTVAGVELIQVDTERHGEDIRCVDSVELFACERRRAHHRVITGGGAAIGCIGDRTRHAGRKYLPDKAIQAFVGDHDGVHVVSSAPRAQRPQRQPVRHLQCVGRKLCEHGRYRARQHRAIAACERDQPGGQGNTDDTRGQLAPFGVSPGHDKKGLVPRAAVFRAEAIHRRTKAPRARAVEVRNLNNPHVMNQNWHACSVNNATSTSRRTAHELPRRPCLYRDTPSSCVQTRSLAQI
jgi:hypothetical protein